MKIKKAEDILEDHVFKHSEENWEIVLKEYAIASMKAYAEQFLKLAAERAKVTTKEYGHGFYEDIVDKDSILDIIKELK